MLNPTPNVPQRNMNHGFSRTRSERIRTASEVALAFSLTEVEAPTYQRIAREVERLRALGLSFNRIAERLAVDGKTVAKAIRWMTTGPSKPGG